MLSEGMGGIYIRSTALHVHGACSLRAWSRAFQNPTPVTMAEVRRKDRGTLYHHCTPYKYK